MLHSIKLLVIAIAVGLAAASTQSFWMDEGGTAFRAMMPSLKEWWRMIIQLKGSDIQMASYMLYAWFWQQKLGFVSEYGLRLSNIPWLVLTVLVLRHVRFWPLVCLLSPFVLYFVNEFRPYSMQIAAGACAAAALGRVIAGTANENLMGVHAVCASCLFLIACSLNGAVYAAAVAIAVIIIRPEWIRTRGFWLRATPWLTASLALGGFYAWTMQMGFRAAEIHDAGILNVLFGIYEMAGFLGLGPGKEELRRSMTVILPYLWILIPAAACFAGAWWFGFYRWAGATPRRIVTGVVCAAVLPILLLAAVGMLMDFRVLGRHLSPTIPAVLLPIAHCLNTEVTSRRMPLLFGVSTCILMLASSLGVRFLERHSKDDYRQASSIVIDALKQGKRVRWQADMNATRYYAYRQGGASYINAIQQLESDPPGLMFADLVIINRPDLRYQGKDHRQLLSRNSFELTKTFHGFEVWTLR
jgi:hypothetical protein